MLDKPNILFVFTDQQRWDTAGCYGQRLNVTPNLDKMAKEGVRFEYAFTCQPVCGPARASIQTGKYPTEIGCHVNDIALPQNEKTIAHYFSESGYEVGYIGKWHLASTGEGEDYKTKPIPPKKRGGYDDYWLAADVLEFTSHGYDGFMYDGNGNKRKFPDQRYRVDVQTDWILEYLETREQIKPFFLMTSFLEPHHQNDKGVFEGPKGSKEKFANYDIPGDLIDLEGDWKEQYPDYLGCCASIDENLGRIFTKLEELNINENTIVIFASDHGCHFKTRNNEYKRSCHDSSLRIPMVAWGKDFSGGRVIDELVSLIDIPPTLLACAGIEKPDYMRGRPLQQLLTDDVLDWPEQVFAQISERQVGRCIRTKRWKYSVYVPGEPIWTTKAGSDIYTEQFLYDLKEDPYEKKNLVNDPKYKGIRKMLSLALKKRMSDCGESVPQILPSQID